MQTSDNIAGIQAEIERLSKKLAELRNERNDLVRQRYQELFNIQTWHKIKAEWVYQEIAKETGLTRQLVKKIIHEGKQI